MKNKKYIHYCWFGGKPLPKLAKKCIKSWKKYLPDYEIIEWNESNVNLDECPFIRGAYDNKKWAFVSDYVRTKALNEMGGIYFDTDMEITKDIKDIISQGSFLGVEDSGFIAVGVWYEKSRNSNLTCKLLEKYKSFKTFDLNELSNNSIPKLITQILEKSGFEYVNCKSIQKLDDIIIYPREYFYPLSYNRENNIFTDNTCMVHYYDASWVPFKERFINEMVRKIGKNYTLKLLNTYWKIKDFIRKIGRVILFPITIKRNIDRKKNYLNSINYYKRINLTLDLIEKMVDKDYIVFYNSDWSGVTSATKELFENLVDCCEIFSKKDIKKIAFAINSSNINQVIFSSFAKGWKDLAICIKKMNPNIKIKTYWHGSHSQVLDWYGWQRNLEIIELHRKGIIDIMATCKKSLIEFYKSQGFNSYFITNKVTTNICPEKKEKRNYLKVGIYAAKCDDWRKNMFSQIAAVSLIPNAVIDMVPLNESAVKFAKTLNVKLVGSENSIPREEMIKRLSTNDINLYVTNSECAPMLPLESMEMGVPCITGNNHHYFINNELEDLVVVKNEESIIEIKDKIISATNNSNKIIKLYKKFSIQNFEESKIQINEFLKM
ncbi:MAG: capsular polysaccharide synthesis protein [bacterium]|nr:capsular polysaccharide synthesis protein [bacterium]